jgi:hypothetical protein
VISSCHNATVTGVYILVTPSNGPSYQVYCDMDTAGGPWMLLYAYNHIGGENIPLVQGTVPISPTTGYSHVNLNQIIDGDGNIVFNAKSVRFYCHTSGHTRKIHFYTSNIVVDQIAYDGNDGNNNPSIWNTGYTLLSDHSGYLPAAVNNVLTDYTNGGLYGGLWNFPFFKLGTYHWAIQSSNNRCGCDDSPSDNSQYDNRLHQVWVNTGE